MINFGVKGNLDIVLSIALNKENNKMRLTARAISSFNSPNSYYFGNQWQVNAGDANTLFFQIVDLDQGPNAFPGIPYSNLPIGSNPGLRYLVGLNLATGLTYGINVIFPSINPALSLTMVATQVSHSDASIWSVSIPSASQPAGGNVMFAVTEGTATRNFSVLNLLAVEYASNGGC